MQRGDKSVAKCNGLSLCARALPSKDQKFYLIKLTENNSYQLPDLGAVSDRVEDMRNRPTVQWNDFAG